MESPPKESSFPTAAASMVGEKGGRVDQPIDRHCRWIKQREKKKTREKREKKKLRFAHMLTRVLSFKLRIGLKKFRIRP